MRPGAFIMIIIVLCFIVSWIIFEYFLPQFVKDGGPVVIGLMVLTMLDITFIIERSLTLKKARGKRPQVAFLKDAMGAIRNNDIKRAVNLCNSQQGTMANVLRAGLERFDSIAEENLTSDRQVQEIKRAFDEANALETPLLERNLIALQTIATIATLVGLLGTTIGMIRAFAAMANEGAPDAIQLALGISEALINTAGGLAAAIMGIVAYNYFVNKVDMFTYAVDEVAQEVLAILTGRA
ncbi:MAG: MotA/TolQ/ExbB proton channel family protein [Gemmatimonadetes bacterium]|nr:MotA/TolQ/ExbB proton channel family protein [Gemmatimonadota bacterium]MYB60517.1 MotA/TolQ/ExbB proton channel family protein [Gemmatimonadota bacterium]MYB63038.1 MotA/TolQ/ExbB proton channel family protein [Gemmatimonadota bacterium]MYD25051.1 MotA/TolQ/ExbB proton channel family protein [Gemmatimonadota bacterium]